MAEAGNINLPGKLLHVQAVSARAMPAAHACAPADKPAQVRKSPESQAQSQLQDLELARKAFQQACQKLQQAHAELLVEAEQQLLELAIEVAQKVLMQEIKAQRYEIDPIVKEALSKMPQRGGVLVRLNPQDLETCRISQNAQDAGSAAVRFVADPSLRRADCVVETDEGVVDASVGRRLEEVASALKEPQ